MTEVFQMVCSDSSQVHSDVPSTSSATVTFTNVFTEGTLGYRYVHEYYIQDEDGYSVAKGEEGDAGYGLYSDLITVAL